MLHSIRLLLAATLTFALAACADLSPRQQRALTGGALGAAGGAAIGGLTGGSAATGALIGGVGGAAAGALIR